MEIPQGSNHPDTKDELGAHHCTGFWRLPRQKAQPLTLQLQVAVRPTARGGQPRHEHDRPHVGELLESSGSRAGYSSQGLAF